MKQTDTGKGLFTNDQLIDVLISDCNRAVGAIAQGQYILWCRLMYEMVQKLANLKVGIVNDLKNREETISSLKQSMKEAGIAIEEIPMEDAEGNPG